MSNIVTGCEKREKGVPLRIQSPESHKEILWMLSGGDGVHSSVFLAESSESPVVVDSFDAARDNFQRRACQK